MLLLPSDAGDAEMDKELSLNMVKEFAEFEPGLNNCECSGGGSLPDIFEAPALEIPCAGESKPNAAVCGVYIPSNMTLPKNWRAVPVRQAISVLNSNLADGRGSLGRMLRAFHIAKWRQDSRFCGSCGAGNADVPGAAERKCPVCGRNEFPRISPAIIVIITDSNNRILLAHNKKFKTGVYSHISGFNDAGESLESTVSREICEEVGIKVRDIVYIKSQPWPFPNSLMLGFKAVYASGTIRCDGVEIEDAKWFTKDNLPALPAPGTISCYLIDRWLDGTL